MNLLNDEYQHTLELYTAKKFNFSVIQTSTSTYIQAGKNRRIYTKPEEEINDIIPNNELFIFKMVQANAKKVKDNFPILDSEDVNYILYSDSMGTIPEYNDFLEFDIKSCYAAAALEMGIIDEKTYNRLKDLSKRARLMAIGSLAKKQTEIRYVNGQPQEPEPKPAPLRHLFFNIAKFVGERMIKIMSEVPSALFFWVDAIFAPKEEAEKILSLIGYECTVKPIKKIKIKKVGTAIKATLYMPEVLNRPKKTFIFGQNQRQETARSAKEKKEQATQATQQASQEDIKDAILNIFGKETADSRDLKNLIRQTDEEYSLLLTAEKYAGNDLQKRAYWLIKYIF